MLKLRALGASAPSASSILLDKWAVKLPSATAATFNTTSVPPPPGPPPIGYVGTFSADQATATPNPAAINH